MKSFDAIWHDFEVKVRKAIGPHKRRIYFSQYKKRFDVLLMELFQRLEYYTDLEASAADEISKLKSELKKLKEKKSGSQTKRTNKNRQSEEGAKVEPKVRPEAASEPEREKREQGV